MVISAISNLIRSVATQTKAGALGLTSKLGPDNNAVNLPDYGQAISDKAKSAKYN